MSTYLQEGGFIGYNCIVGRCDINLKYTPLTYFTPTLSCGLILVSNFYLGWKLYKSNRQFRTMEAGKYIYCINLGTP